MQEITLKNLAKDYRSNEAIRLSGRILNFRDQISSGCTEEEKVRDGAQHTAHHAGIGLIFNLIVDFVLIFRRDAVQQLFELMNGINRHQRQEKTDADMKRRCHRAEPLAEIFDCTDNAVLKIHKNPRSQRAARTGDNKIRIYLITGCFFIENPPLKNELVYCFFQIREIILPPSLPAPLQSLRQV